MAAEPELIELATALGDHDMARALARAPGGWRDLSEAELDRLGLCGCDQKKVIALQKLVSRGYPELRLGALTTPDDVGAVYTERLGGLVTEVMLAIALDGRNHALCEIEVGRGGRHSMCVTAADVLRPLVRAGASGFVLVHNHPSGSPEPSREDVEMTDALSAAADIVGIALVDHVVIGARGGGFVSMLESGFIERKEHHEPFIERGSRSALGRAAESE